MSSYVRQKCFETFNAIWISVQIQRSVKFLNLKCSDNKTIISEDCNCRREVWSWPRNSLDLFLSSELDWSTECWHYSPVSWHCVAIRAQTLWRWDQILKTRSQDSWIQYLAFSVREISAQSAAGMSFQQSVWGQIW